MNHEDLKKHLDGRFDRVEDKIDSHLERISKAEEALKWIGGHQKISTTFLLGLISAIILAWANN